MRAASSSIESTATSTGRASPSTYRNRKRMVLLQPHHDPAERHTRPRPPAGGRAETPSGDEGGRSSRHKNGAANGNVLGVVTLEPARNGLFPTQPPMRVHRASRRAAWSGRGKNNFSPCRI